MNCPTCGGLSTHIAGGPTCLRNQLAKVTAENRQLKANLAECETERDVAMESLAAVTAERDALLEACRESLIVLVLSNSQIVDPRHAIELVESAIAKCEGGK